jgi:hypothetical protein
METFVQIAILICSSSVAFLVGSKKATVRKTAFVIGLCGQPFWFYTSFIHKQWAIVLLSGWYAFCYIRGILNAK